MRKMDEMEMKISLEATRWTWFFTVVALFAWVIYDFIRTGAVTLPLYLLITQNVVYFFAVQISKWKMGDSRGTTAVIWYLLAVVVCIAGFGVLLFVTGR